MNGNSKSKINDLNLKDWKEYKDILTDSLWLIVADGTTKDVREKVL